MEFPAIEYFSFSGYSLFVVNKNILFFIHSCRENFHMFASKLSPTSSPNCTDQYQYWLNT
jgi:hypothetical protein